MGARVLFLSDLYGLFWPRRLIPVLNDFLVAVFITLFVHKSRMASESFRWANYPLCTSSSELFVAQNSVVISLFLLQKQNGAAGIPFYVRTFFGKPSSFFELFTSSSTSSHFNDGLAG